MGGRTEEKGMLKVKGPKETGKELEGENVFSWLVPPLRFFIIPRENCEKLEGIDCRECGSSVY